jgi:hypothetical protein
LPTIAEACGTDPPNDIDGISLMPTLLSESAAGRPQQQHEFLYWEINGWTAIRQASWRAVRPAKASVWELYDLANDPAESDDVAAANPDIVKRLIALAESTHEPVREGTFASTELHQRDRRAKFGKHDDPNFVANPAGPNRYKQNRGEPNEPDPKRRVKPKAATQGK